MKKPSVCNVALFCAVTAMSLAWAVPANAISLVYLSSFDTNEDVDGLVFDSVSGYVFTVDNDSTDQMIYEYQTDGTFVGSVTAAVNNLRGIDILANGNFIVASNATGSERVVELDSTGAIVAGGIDISLNGDVADNNGVVFDTLTGTLFVADEDDDVVRQYSTAGVLLDTIDISAAVMVPLGAIDSEGIAINPLNGNLLIGDAIFGASDVTLFEITTGGALVSLLDLSVLTGQGLNNLQGLSVGGGRLYAGQGFEDRVDIFAIVDTTTGVPEPVTGVLGLMGLGVLGMATRRRVA